MSFCFTNRCFFFSSSILPHIFPHPYPTSVTPPLLLLLLTSHFLQEAHRKFKGWMHYDTVHNVDVSYLKPGDGVPLWLWRGTVEVQATHTAVFTRLWNQRYTMFCGVVMRLTCEVV